METRTSYILVGAFLIAAVAGLIGFIIWAVKSDADTQYTLYRSYFTGSVSGLNETSDVRYRGIPIGQVTDIRIDPDNVERIRVTMRIVASTPIKEDSIASVEQQGITGVAYIQISGGSQASPLLEAKGDQKFPVIIAKRSQLEALFADTPELINRIMKLTDRVALLFDDRNLVSISETLTNLQTLTAALADSSQKIAELIDDTAAFAGDLRMAGKEIDGLMKDARGAVGQV
ncbi:MAG: MCE family protein, partial [Alphaproteobacteria bacterium]|nr:MCE family protein [Alphaproteobacteria bacterium]